MRLKTVKHLAVVQLSLFATFVFFNNCSGNFKADGSATLAPSGNGDLGLPTGVGIVFSAKPDPITLKTVDSISFVKDGKVPGIAKLECSLDDAAFASCVSPVALVLSVKAHSFQVRGLDSKNTAIALSEKYIWNVVVDTGVDKPNDTIGWIPCATRFTTCTFTGSRRVLYGVSPFDHNRIKTFSNSVECNNPAFDNIDPAENSWDLKFCWYEGTYTPPYPTMKMAGPYIDVYKISTGYPGHKIELIGPQYTNPDPSDLGAFREPCRFSHFSYDDPIVYPGQPGKSHLHAFFGNAGANAFSTVDSMANSGDSTCAGGTLNRTGYWVPAMIDTKDGRPVEVTGITTYYKSGYYGIKPADIREVPVGLRMIVGDSKNSGPGGNAAARYHCQGPTTNTGWQQTIPSCNVGDDMVMNVIFPQCWDGVNLDSVDHKSHMAFPVAGACPQTHPVPIPVIEYNIAYRIHEASEGLRWRLSSDTYDNSIPAGYSGHADYFFGWKPEIMKTFIKSCVQASVDCHDYLLGDGRMLKDE